MNENDERTDVHEEPRPMSEEDVKDYLGITLSENGEEERKQEENDIHVEIVDIHQIPFWKKALFGLAILVILILGVAVAWVFLLGGGVLLVALAIMYFLKRYVL